MHRFKAGDGLGDRGNETFYAGSLTKQMIGLVAAEAVIDGVLDPNQPVHELLPGSPRWAQRLRVRHLVHHTGALPQPPDLGRVLGRSGDDLHVWSTLTNDDVRVGWARAAEPSGWRPGVAFSYDNTGYILLAEVIESVGVSIAGALAELTDTAGMPSTRLGVAPGSTVAGSPHPPRTVGDGGIWTTAADWLAWQTTYSSRADAAARLATTPGALDDGTPLDYAWGLRVTSTPRGPAYLHGGSWPGWNCFAIRRPSTHEAIVAWSTTDAHGIVRLDAMGMLPLA